MNLADRIQKLRKKRGISQEGLAEQLGVTRQAVSKWEGDQCAPDLEKIIMLSDFFEVTTDYLLKGVEAEAQGKGKEVQAGEQTAAQAVRAVDTRIFAVIGTAFNLIGLISATIIWIEQQRAYSIAVGLLIMIMGCTIFAVGYMNGTKSTKATTLKRFLQVNVWIVGFIPWFCCYNLATCSIWGVYPRIAPVPLIINSLYMYALGWGMYILGCAAVDLWIVWKERSQKTT